MELNILNNEVKYNYNLPEYLVKNTNTWRCFINFVKERQLDINKKSVIVSLSGGVDSMVFLYICDIYKLGYIYNFIHKEKIINIHLKYNIEENISFYTYLLTMRKIKKKSYFNTYF